MTQDVSILPRFFEYLHMAYQSAEDVDQYDLDSFNKKNEEDFRTSISQQYVHCANFIDFCLMKGSEIKTALDSLYVPQLKESTNDNPT